jgi:hypothetical protein
MAKADLILPNGTTVKIEGTAEEVAELLDKISLPQRGAGKKPPKKRRNASSKAKTSMKKATRKGPQVLIGELAEEDYFKAKRAISDVQKKLEEKGHIYALESLSMPLLRLTRKKVLRRIKEDNNWVYVS